MVAMALFAAMLIVGEAEAGRHFRHHHHHHHHGPPAPPGYNEPKAAPSPYFRGEPSPADGPAGFPFAGGPESSRSRGLFESGSFADSPFAFGEGPAADCPPRAEGPEGYHPQRALSESDGFADSPFAFGEGPAPGEGPVFGEGPAPEAGW